MSLSSLVRRTLRGIREHLYLNFVAAGVIATSLVLLGVFVLAVVNLRLMVGTWEQDAHLSAYFQEGQGEAAREAARQAVAGRPEVADVRYVTEADARAWLTERTPDLAPVLGELGEDALPASLEITLKSDHTSAADIERFAGTLTEVGVFADVDYGQEWVSRLATFLSLLTALGTALGIIICIATLFLVGNTVHLVVNQRRDELEIMRLVGATDTFILGPFLVEGALQGAAGGLGAVGALYAIHRGLLAGASQLLTLAVGAQGIQFLSGSTLALLALAGVALGMLAAAGAVQRFLRTLP